MKKIKAAVIGGASITWMPTFYNDLSRCAALSGGEVVLHDIDGKNLETMYALSASRILAREV